MGTSPLVDAVGKWSRANAALPDYSVAFPASIPNSSTSKWIIDGLFVTFSLVLCWGAYSVVHNKGALRLPWDSLLLVTGFRLDLQALG